MKADYLPYGGLITGGGLNVTENDYLWTGKELQHQLFETPSYDSNARLLFTNGLFASLDPLAEKYPGISPYAYCAGNPISRIDKSGNCFETAFDVVSLVADVHSLVSNIKEGNVGGAIVDGIGTVFDAAAVILPVVPAVAGHSIKAIRALDKGTDALKAADRVVDGAKAADRVKDSTKGAENAASFVKGRVHGNSAASTKAQHAYDIVDTDTDDVVKTGVSGGPIRRDGKSVRAESQVRKWNQEAGYEKYRSTITHEEPAGEGARRMILDYEKERAQTLRQNGQLDLNKHKRP